MAIRKRLKPANFRDRILQADVVKLLQEKFGVSHPTAMRYLRTYGPEPIERMGQKIVWFRKSEVNEWLTQAGKD